MNKVTIGIPTRNRAQYLLLALESAFQQTYPNLEIIVSDNACTDETPSMLAAISDRRLRVLRQETMLSMVENWNRCVGAATGQYFLLLSDDDLLEPAAIECMVAAFETETDPQQIGFVYCRGRVIDANGALLREGRSAPHREDDISLILAFFRGHRETWPCSILFRFSDIEAGYSSNFPVITDAALWVKAVVAHGFVVHVDQPLVNYRFHQSLTAATSVRGWQQENDKLAAFVITTLQQAGKADAALVRQIQQAVRALNRHVALALPLNVANTTRRAVLWQYLRHLSDFNTVPALLRWIRATAVLFLPASAVSRWRSFRGKPSLGV